MQHRRIAQDRSSSIRVGFVLLVTASAVVTVIAGSRSSRVAVEPTPEGDADTVGGASVVAEPAPGVSILSRTAVPAATQALPSGPAPGPAPRVQRLVAATGTAAIDITVVDAATGKTIANARCRLEGPGVTPADHEFADGRGTVHLPQRLPTNLLFSAAGYASSAVRQLTPDVEPSGVPLIVRLTRR